MNMITFTARSRERIIYFHESLIATLEARDAMGTEAALGALEAYTRDLGHAVAAKRHKQPQEQHTA